MLEERREALYAGLPQVQQERLRAFWWAHPVRTLQFEGVAWRYLEGGTGDRLVILIPGAFFSAQMWLAVQERLEQAFRVIALDSPSRVGVHNLATVAKGLGALITTHDAFGAALVGHAEGALAAQWLLQQAPHRVHALALINSALLDSGERTDPLTRTLHWLERKLPWRLTSRAAPLQRELAIPAASEWGAHAVAMLSHQGQGLSRERLLALQSALDASQAAFRFAPRTLAGWQGETVVIAASDDWQTARDATAIASRYRRARVHWFSEGGHHLPLLFPEAVADQLLGLLSDAWAPPPEMVVADYLKGTD